MQKAFRYRHSKRITHPKSFYSANFCALRLQILSRQLQRIEFSIYLSKKFKEMKTYFNKSAAFLVIVAALFFVSCSKSATDPVTPPDKTTADLTAALTTGKWAVSSFIEKTEDKTSKFKDIEFTFSTDGTVTATSKNGSSVKGSWHYTPAVTYYGSTSKAAMALNMGASTPLDLLTKTWNFISSTSTTLKVDSPELLEDKHVQFSKL
jgi:hypothetical protein